MCRYVLMNVAMCHGPFIHFAIRMCTLAWFVHVCASLCLFSSTRKNDVFSNPAHMETQKNGFTTQRAQAFLRRASIPKYVSNEFTAITVQMRSKALLMRSTKQASNPRDPDDTLRHQQGPQKRRRGSKAPGATRSKFLNLEARCSEQRL